MMNVGEHRTRVTHHSLTTHSSLPVHVRSEGFTDYVIARDCREKRTTNPDRNNGPTSLIGIDIRKSHPKDRILKLLNVRGLSKTNALTVSYSLLQGEKHPRGPK